MITQLILFKNKQNDAMIKKLKEEKVKMLVNIFIRNLKLSVAESRKKVESANSSMVAESKTKAAGRKRATKATFDRVSMVKDQSELREATSINPLESPGRGWAGKLASGEALDMGSKKKETVSLRKVPIFESNAIRTQIDSRPLDARRPTVAFKDDLKLSTVRHPNKAFAIFPQAVEYSRVPTLVNSDVGSIKRHNSRADPTRFLTSSPPIGQPKKSVKIQANQGEKTPISQEVRASFVDTVYKSMRLSRLLANSRLRVIKSEDKKKTEKQEAIDAVLDDDAMTPTLKKRKIKVIEQDFKHRDAEKKRLKEAQRKQEIEDAIRGKR